MDAKEAFETSSEFLKAVDFEDGSYNYQSESKTKSAHDWERGGWVR